MMQMTDYQRELVAQHLELVEQTIRKRIKICGGVLLTYEDFYQTGCEALCRAAMKYKHDVGSFEPFACRVIYNALIDYCRSQNVHLYSQYGIPLESDSDDYALEYMCTINDLEDEIHVRELRNVLSASKARYSGITLRGIEAMELRCLGYSTRDIARRYETTPNNVNAWISRARSRLTHDPELMKLFA